MPFPNLVSVLQIAIGPVILISGVGLLLLTMSNRFGRIIDRTRQLTHELRAGIASPEATAAQLDILLRQARIARGALAAASTSALFAAVLIVVIFVGTLFGLSFAVPAMALFAACLASLIVALTLMILDVNLALEAFSLEVDAVKDHLDAHEAADREN
jgi:hypothetical protein